MKQQPKRKILFLALIAIAIIGLAIGVIILVIYRKPTEKVSCSPDPYSGETICEATYEEEIADLTKNSTSFIGLSFLDEHGFSNTQQDAILSNLKTYFTGFSSLSYEKNSFDYDPVGSDFSKSHFKLISDTSESFLVRLDTKGSIASVSVSIEKL